MTLASSISEHLISFDLPDEADSLYPFPEADPEQNELEAAKLHIAELEQRLAAAEDAARSAVQSEIDALVKQKDEELQAGLDELQATYEAKVGQLAEELQTEVLQHNKDLAGRLAAWCRPVLKSMSTNRCIEDLAAVIETLLNENCELIIKGPEHLLSLLEPHLSNLPAPTWTMTQTEGPEVIITAGESRIETCLEEWLKTVEGDVNEQ